MTNDSFYAQKRNKPILNKNDLYKYYPNFLLNFKELADHSYINQPVSEELIPLKEKLLSFGGTRTCLPDMEEDLKKILSRGQLWLGDKVIFKKGAPSQCHKNSAYLWEANKNLLKICTGYALSEDGIWRQHSWCIWAKARVNKIVETTVPRLLYFGFVMDEDECYEFSSWY